MLPSNTNQPDICWEEALRWWNSASSSESLGGARDSTYWVWTTTLAWTFPHKLLNTHIGAKVSDIQWQKRPGAWNLQSRTLLQWDFGETCCATPSAAPCFIRIAEVHGLDLAEPETQAVSGYIITSSWGQTSLSPRCSSERVGATSSVKKSSVLERSREQGGGRRISHLLPGFWFEYLQSKWNQRFMICIIPCKILVFITIAG